MSSKTMLLVILLLNYSVSFGGFGSYGNYCGAGHGEEGETPIDQLDAICCAHDTCCHVGGDVKLEVATFCTNYCSTELVSSTKKVWNELDCTTIDATKNPTGACGTIFAAQQYANTNAGGAKIGQEVVEISKSAEKAANCAISGFQKKKCKKVTKQTSIDAEVKKKMASQTCNFDNWEQYSLPGKK